MSTVVAVSIVALLIILIALTEVAAATLPLLVVIALVPHEHRQQLADLIAVVDHRRRLRLWAALRAGVAARRRLDGDRAAGQPR